MRSRRIVPLILAATMAVPTAAMADRPAGNTFTWGHDLRIKLVPGWSLKKNPYTAAQWTRVMNRVLENAGRNGMWYSGGAALPFDLPLHPTEPIRGWFNPRNFLRLHRALGMRWDVNPDLRVAQLARDRKWHTAWNIKNTIPARRYLMISPGWDRAAKAEIRRVVPKYRNLPYRNYYNGVDEPMIFPPAGPAERSKLWRSMRTSITRTQGVPPPTSRAAETTHPYEGLKWVAFNRWTGDRFFTMRKGQVDLIRRLDPKAVVSPNDYAFIDGFIPWDYTRLAEFADVVELDPYVSYDEAKNPGRGRYNQGFGSKFMADLTGKRVRTIVQAFPYQGYRVQPADLWTWTSQALRAGATDITLYSETNPRITDRRLYAEMMKVANAMRTARVPDMPNDPATVVVYNTASEAQGRPNESFAVRPRTQANAMYTTYSVLGELVGSSFVFDADTRLAADPSRLARARTVYLPRAEVVDRPFADALVAWVRAGGTLVVTDRNAFTRTTRNQPLGDVRAALFGTEIAPATGPVTMAQDGLGAGFPARPLSIATVPSGKFVQPPADARVIGVNPDGSPAAMIRHVGAGRVIAFAGEPMFPRILDAPGGLPDFVAAIQRNQGAPVGMPVWSWELPGTPQPGRLPWAKAVRPADVVTPMP